jgi:hypothetical protein
MILAKLSDTETARAGQRRKPPRAGTKASEYGMSKPSVGNGWESIAGVDASKK